MKEYKVSRFMALWLKSPPAEMMPRIEAFANRHGCWAHLWQNPYASLEPGWLFWLETHIDGAGGRMQELQADLRFNPELRELNKWFQSTA